MNIIATNNTPIIIKNNIINNQINGYGKQKFANTVCNIQQANIKCYTTNSPLRTINYIQLADSTLVPDYSQDDTFLARLKAMSYQEAEDLNRQIIANTNTFPMPCMAITANKINICLQNMLAYELNLAEKKILHKLYDELTLLAPVYPYKQSLIFTYKFLVCKSFIDYKSTFELQSVSQVSNNNKLFEFQKFNLDYNLTTIYLLPWHQLIDNTQNLMSELNKLCDCLNIVKLNEYLSANLNTTNDQVTTVNLSHNALVPYTEELNIEDLNKIWNFSLSLVGCSLLQITNADANQMLASSFFDHDLSHVVEQQLHNKYENLQIIFNWVKNIYLNKQLLSSLEYISFEAIELAIFFTVHEVPGGCSNYLMKNSLLQMIRMEPFIVIEDLPAKYKGLSVKNVLQAAKFLAYLPEKDFTESNFTQSIIKLINQITTLKLDELTTPAREFINKQLQDEPEQLKKMAIDNIERPIDKPIDHQIAINYCASYLLLDILGNFN